MFRKEEKTYFFYSPSNFKRWIAFLLQDLKKAVALLMCIYIYSLKYFDYLYVPMLHGIVYIIYKMCVKYIVILE